MYGKNQFDYLKSNFNNPNDNIHQNTYFKTRPETAYINARSNITSTKSFNKFLNQKKLQGVQTNIWKKRDIKFPKPDGPKYSINNIDLGINNISSSDSNIYSPNRVYLILKNDLIQFQQTFSYSRKTTIDFKKLNLTIYSTSQEIAFLIE